MRYVNLKKRNTSKFHYLAKHTAYMSFIRLVVTAIVFVPLLTNQKSIQAKQEADEVLLINEIEDANVEQVSSFDLYEIEE